MANANVFAAFAQPVKSVQDYQDEAENRRAMRNRNALQALALQQQQDQAQQATRKRNAIEQVMAGMRPGATDEERADAFAANPLTMDVADQLRKSSLDRRKTEAEIGDKNATSAKTQFATSEDKRKAAIQQVAALNSPDEAKQLLNQQVQAGAISMPAAQALGRMIDTDPKWQVRLVMGINDPKEMLAALQPHMVNAGGAFVNTNPMAGPTGQGQPNAIPITQSADNAATQETQRRGQNMTDSRAREANALTREANANTYDTERGMLVNRQTGLARPAVGIDGKPIGAKDKPLTDSQAKAFAFGTRMRAANDIIDQLEQAGTVKTMPGMGGNGVLGRTLTAVAPEKQQQLEQAKRDWINANLRRESGAVIGQSEFDSADRQYFAQPGDSPAVVAQKAANRKRAEQGVLVEVPDARRPSAQSGPTVSNW